MGAPLRLWFGSEVVRYLYSFRRSQTGTNQLVGGGGIFCAPPFGSNITSNMNSTSHYRLLEFLTLAFSPISLVPSFGGRWRVTELGSTLSMNFTLGMDEVTYIFTAELLVWGDLLGPLVGWALPLLMFK